MACKLSLAEDFVNSYFEVLNMRAEYFKDIVEHGVDQARKMYFLVEQNNDAVHSESYRAVIAVLTAKI